MNADHRDSLVLLARRHAGIEAEHAAMTSRDRLGFQVRLTTSEGVRGARIAFLREVSSPAEPDAFLSRWLNRTASLSDAQAQTCSVPLRIES